MLEVDIGESCVEKCGPPEVHIEMYVVGMCSLYCCLLLTAGRTVCVGSEVPNQMLLVLGYKAKVQCCTFNPNYYGI